MAESEADTPSTPIEFESKYFEFDGVRLPPFCRGKMEEIAGFSLRSSDIWIVTYPKSGKPACASLCEAALLRRVQTDALRTALFNTTCFLHHKRFDGRRAASWRPQHGFPTRPGGCFYATYTRAQQSRTVAFCTSMLRNGLIRTSSVIICRLITRPSKLVCCQTQEILATVQCLHPPTAVAQRFRA